MRHEFVLASLSSEGGEGQEGEGGACLDLEGLRPGILSGEGALSALTLVHEHIPSRRMLRDAPGHNEHGSKENPPLNLPAPLPSAVARQ